MRRLPAVAAIATLVCKLSSLCAAPEKQIDLAAIVSKKDAESTFREAVVTFGMGGCNDEKAALEKARTLARKIFAKL